VCVGVFIFSELMTVVMSECVFLFLILQLVDSVARRIEVTTTPR
jgi:hypothetical protein